MNYNSKQLFFQIKQQTQGVDKKSTWEGVKTEIYPETGPDKFSNQAKFLITTTTIVKEDYFKVTSESGYEVDEYKFPKPVKSSDQKSIKILSKLARHALKTHSDTYDKIKKAPVFNDRPIPDKSDEQLMKDFAEIFKTREIRPDQSN